MTEVLSLDFKPEDGPEVLKRMIASFRSWKASDRYYVEMMEAMHPGIASKNDFLFDTAESLGNQGMYHEGIALILVSASLHCTPSCSDRLWQGLLGCSKAMSFFAEATAHLQSPATPPVPEPDPSL